MLRTRPRRANAAKYQRVGQKGGIKLDVHANSCTYPLSAIDPALDRLQSIVVVLATAFLEKPENPEHTECCTMKRP
jgi:hypothetical protein